MILQEKLQTLLMQEGREIPKRVLADLAVDVVLALHRQVSDDIDSIGEEISTMMESDLEDEDAEDVDYNFDEDPPTTEENDAEDKPA